MLVGHISLVRVDPIRDRFVVAILPCQWKRPVELTIATYIFDKVIQSFESLLGDSNYRLALSMKRKVMRWTKRWRRGRCRITKMPQPFATVDGESTNQM